MRSTAHPRLHASLERAFHTRPGRRGREVLVRAYRGGAAKLLKDSVKEIQTPAANRVRFVFKAPWPDFPAFYGTFVASAGWVVPKKYVERVGEEGFRKAPIGAGPYRFVSLNPGVELVVEAFEGTAQDASIKRLVFAA